MSGPSSKRTRHSELSQIKHFLLTGRLPQAHKKVHENFGTALHEKFLEDKTTKRKLTIVEQRTIERMIQALRKDVVVVWLMEDSIREKRLSFTIHGVPMGGTPDIKQPKPKRISDLKSTVCGSLQEFVEKAFTYGYFRQGVTYLKGTGYKEYYIIGIQKQAPFSVFIVYLQDPQFRSIMRYCEKELEFLLYIFKHYGKPNKLKI